MIFDGTIYLYADGHAVILHREYNKRAGTIEWAEIVEEYGPRCNFDGRIIFHSRTGLGKHIRKAKEVRAVAPDLKNGSENTRSKGIEVGYLTLSFGPSESFHVYDMPGLMAGEYTYQPDVCETFDPQADSWSSHNVAKITRKKATKKEEV